MAVDVEPEDRAGLFLGVLRVLRELDPAGLAAAAGEHLRLDNDRAAEPLGRETRLVWGHRQPALRDRDPEAAEELLALVLVQVHRPEDSI